MKKHFELKNGIRVHIAPSPGTKAATVLVLCKVGSRYEYKEINGASHFIEHLMFKGTKKRPTALDISKSLDSIGAEYNAYTGKDITGYYIKSAGEHVGLSAEMLHDMLFNSLYKEEEMDRERQVIIEEINMYEDNPIMFVEDLLEQGMFEGNTLGWEIAGSRKTMKEMTRDNVIAFRNEYYVPSRIVIVVAGNVPEDIEHLLEKTFGTVPNHTKEPTSFSPFGDLPSRTTPRVKIQNKKSEQVQVAFGFPGIEYGNEDDSVMKVFETLLGGPMSSRLFISVRERRGLAYMVRASSNSYEDTGMFMVRAGLDKSRLKLATKVILDEIESVVKKGVDADEVRRAKDYVKGKALLGLEDSSNLAEWYARQELFLNKTKTPDERLEELETVTPKQVQQLAERVFDTSKLCVAGIGPFESEDAFLQELDIT